MSHEERVEQTSPRTEVLAEQMAAVADLVQRQGAPHLRVERMRVPQPG